MAYRVAIVDDSNTDAVYMDELLKVWARKRNVPLQSHCFSSAEQFLFRYAEDKDWDILLLDIEMGAMDGVTMAKRVRQDNEAVQIVFITGYSDYIAEGYEVAALHYLMKPVNREKLQAVLDRALEKRKQEERYSNLEAYGEMGGAGLQFNVVDAETLQKALRDPDSYRNLMVRVWGYNDYFTALTQERQQHILTRTIQESL